MNSSHENLHRRKNPLDSWGNRSRCAICESIFHWAKDCPHNLERQTNNTAEEFDVELFTNNIHECYIEKFVGEMLGCAVLDSGCTKMCVVAHCSNATKKVFSLMI